MPITYDKSDRVLDIYARLLSGHQIFTLQETARYNISERSFKRDIKSIRKFLDEASIYSGVTNTVDYDRVNNCYKLVQHSNAQFTNAEVLALCKILLASRAFIKDEMDTMLDKLIECCVPSQNKKMVEDLILNESFHYVELQHKSPLIDKMWEIGEAIKHRKKMQITYERKYKPAVVTRTIKPVAILFSEFYFYLTAFIDDEHIESKLKEHGQIYPTIYRIDRIQTFNVLNEHFKIFHRDRFEEGEFRKRIQFMQGGKLCKVKFKYKGNTLDAILDRLPTAEVIEHTDDGVVLKAEAFGRGIEMWLRSQGDLVEDVEVK